MISSKYLNISIWHGIQVISGFELKEKSDIGICGKGHCLHRPCTHNIFSQILSVFSANIHKPFQHFLIILWTLIIVLIFVKKSPLILKNLK